MFCKLDSNECRTEARVRKGLPCLFADSLPCTDGRGPDSSLSSNGKEQVKAECFDGVPLQACLLTLTSGVLRVPVQACLLTVTSSSVSTSPGVRSSPACWFFAGHGRASGLDSSVSSNGNTQLKAECFVCPFKLASDYAASRSPQPKRLDGGT